MHATSRIGCSGLDFADLEYFSGSDGDNNMAGAVSMTPDVFNKALTERLISSAYVTRRNDTHTPELKATRDHYPADVMDSNPVLKQAASDIDTMAFVEVIQQAPDIESLQELLSLCSENSVSINHLIVGDPDQMISKERQYKRFNTFEFRQHAAATDATEALPWIEFVQTLVKYAHSTSTEDIISECKRAAADSSFGLKDMFRLLRVTEETQTFYLHHPKQTVQRSIDAARAEAENLGAEDPFRKTVLALLNDRAEYHNPDKVPDTIRKKFEQGGYGQFSRDFTDGHAPWLDDEIKIGWKPEEEEV